MDKDKIIASVKDKVKLPDGVADKLGDLLDGDLFKGKIDKDEMSIDRCMWLCLKLGLHPEDIKATELFRDKDGITYGKQQDISDYMESNEKPQKVTLRMIYELLEKIYELLNELRRKESWQQ